MKSNRFLLLATCMLAATVWLGGGQIDKEWRPWLGGRGALVGRRYRVLVSTDVGETDPV